MPVTDILESSTNCRESLEAAQHASLQRVAAAIARAVREGVDAERYVVKDGVVRLAEGSRMAAGDT